MFRVEFLQFSYLMRPLSLKGDCLLFQHIITCMNQNMAEHLWSDLLKLVYREHGNCFPPENLLRLPTSQKGNQITTEEIKIALIIILTGKRSLG